MPISSKRQPCDYERRILLAVTGLAPQIITETIYGLAMATPAFVPTEVHIITTTEGAERANLFLLSKDPGWYYRLLKDYNLQGIYFDKTHIHVIHNAAGQPLQDIRSPEENRQVANFILAQMQHHTADEETALHVSIAGGRKTMGFYLGYALSLYGRQQDRLSHVLVSPPFESHPGFFYPTPERHIIHTYPPDSRPLDTSQATVTLAEISFARLRENLPARMISTGTFAYDEIVQAAQGEIAPSLRINTAQRSLQMGEEEIFLAPAEFAFYSWLAMRKSKDLPPIRHSDDGLAKEYLAHYGDMIGQNSGDYSRAEHALCDGMSKEYFDPRKSKANGCLIDALGRRNASPYLIVPFGKRPLTRFGLRVEKEAIQWQH